MVVILQTTVIFMNVKTTDGLSPTLYIKCLFSGLYFCLCIYIWIYSHCVITKISKHGLCLAGGVLQPIRSMGPEHLLPSRWVRYGPLARYIKLRVAHAPGMPPLVSDPDMYHGTCVTHVPWYMPRSLKSGFIWSRWRGKRSRHSRRMRNPQFQVSGKRPMELGTSSGPYWYNTEHVLNWWGLRTAKRYYDAFLVCDGYAN